MVQDPLGLELGKQRVALLVVPRNVEGRGAAGLMFQANYNKRPSTTLKTLKSVWQPQNKLTSNYHCFGRIFLVYLFFGETMEDHKQTALTVCAPCHGPGSWPQPIDPTCKLKRLQQQQDTALPRTGRAAHLFSTKPCLSALWEQLSMYKLLLANVAPY